jgi:hypothetical protein
MLELIDCYDKSKKGLTGNSCSLQFPRGPEVREVTRSERATASYSLTRNGPEAFNLQKLGNVI